MTNQKFDTPFPIKFIKIVSDGFDLARANPDFKLPIGDWWQKNQPIAYYQGMFAAINMALTGIEGVGSVAGATPATLHAELHSILGQLANIIIEKAPKIEVIDK